MKLYTVDLSPFAASVRLAVYAKGIESEVEFATPHDGDPKSPGYLTVNPIGKLPCLDTGHFQLPESSTINEYLEERFPKPSLLPESVEDRARARLLVRLVDLYLYAGLSKLFQQFRPGEGSAETVAAGLEEISAALGYIEPFLDDQECAVGAAIGLADCSLVPALFYCSAMLPRFESSFGGAAAAYFERVGLEQPAGRVIDELQTALEERMAGG